MISFVDGPAKGQLLMLKRAPMFLRVTKAGGIFDALDQINDTPKPEEALFAYELDGKPTSIHIKATDGGGFFVVARYRYITLQPADAEMRRIEPWCAWCHRQANMEAPVEL